MLNHISVYLGRERKTSDWVFPQGPIETDIGHHSSAKVKVCSIIKKEKDTYVQ